MFDDRKNYDWEDSAAEESRSDRALRGGLYDLPTPEVSVDFDRRIQAALVRHPSWWQRFWASCQPAIPTAACTLTGMLLLLHFSQQTPVMTLTASSPAYAPAINHTMLTQKVYEAPDEDLDKVDLTYASLNFLSHPLHHGEPGNTHKSG